MLFSGTIPEVLAPVVEHILMNMMENLKDDIDEAELHFLDVSWLGLVDDKRSFQWKKEHTLDAMRKVETVSGKQKSVGVQGETKMRHCTRCCAVMEDLIPVRGGNLWLLNMQKQCFCGGYWILE